MVATFERNSSGVISIEKMVSQKSTSDVRVSAHQHPPEAKERVLTRGASFVGHPGSWDGDTIPSKCGGGEHTQVIAIVFVSFLGLGLGLIVGVGISGWGMK